MNAPDNVQRLNDQLLADSELRQRFLQDPRAVVEEEFEILLSDEQRAKLLAQNWEEKSEDELIELVSGPGVGILF